MLGNSVRLLEHWQARPSVPRCLIGCYICNSIALIEPKETISIVTLISCVYCGNICISRRVMIQMCFQVGLQRAHHRMIAAVSFF